MADTDTGKAATLVNAEQREAAKWEYKGLDSSNASGIGNLITARAAEGWEVVSFQVAGWARPDNSAERHCFAALLRRRLPEPSGEPMDDKTFDAIRRIKTLTSE
jgi:hypothetical protein